MKTSEFGNTSIRVLILSLMIFNFFSCLMTKKAVQLTQKINKIDTVAILEAIEKLDTANVPRYIIRINVHFFGSANGNFYRGDREDLTVHNGVSYAHRFVNHANWVMSDLKESPLSSANFLGHSRIHYALYTNNHPLDTFGGIWFSDTWNESNRYYQDSVLHISFMDTGEPGDFHISGYACGLTFCNDLTLLDAYDNAKNNGPFGWWAFAGSLNHEFGHILGLCHSFYCDNECNGIDIDVNKECRINPCHNSCGGPHGGRCDNWPSGSRNIMGYNADGTALTPCQWKRIMKNLLYTNALYVEKIWPTQTRMD